jgi:hypothetical protein
LSGRVRWAGEGEADVVAVESIQVTVRSTRPFPPGAPAQGTLDEAHPFTLKVAGSRREADAFIVRGRLVSATVAVREAFARAVATGLAPS